MKSANGASNRASSAAESSSTHLLSPVSEDPGSTPKPNGRLASLLVLDDTNGKALPALASGKGHARAGRSRSSSSPLRGSDLSLSADAAHAAATRRKSTVAPLEVKRPTQNDVMKLSPAQIYNLTTAPDSLPVRPASPVPDDLAPLAESRDGANQFKSAQVSAQRHGRENELGIHHKVDDDGSAVDLSGQEDFDQAGHMANGDKHHYSKTPSSRPAYMSRSASIPMHTRKDHRPSEAFRTPSPAVIQGIRQRHQPRKERIHEPLHSDPRLEPPPSPPMQTVPLPPNSIPTYLQLELSSDRPSPLYIHRPASSDVYYESSKVKFERLLNFLKLPPYLEQILLFGALACLDSWLYTFTVLPLRFAKSLWLLGQWALISIARESRELALFVWSGSWRLWRRALRRESAPQPTSEDSTPPSRSSAADMVDATAYRRPRFRGHRRTRSVASSLQQNHKADLLQGLLIVVSCTILMRFDASRMYHTVRGQAAIKLYVIYNVLEVFDRLFSAVGQDILECLFSKETLERGPDGRSKVLQPFWMFLLALAYTVIHSTALLYQVITLNVAVNSYSNALLTLLMSNQFVEIKGSVFKKFEKENLFQLTCADVVERFQLWLMLLVIALRNIVEVGGLSITTKDDMLSGPTNFGATGTGSPPPSSPNATNPVTSTFGILPEAFTLMPTLNSFQVLSPFMLVLGSEMLVDWLKHAYITKFNATSPRIYARFLDVLAKDYYAHAFVDQNLTRRLGLPVIPLACLFIRAILQTYHMFLAVNLSLPTLSTATSLSLDNEEATSSPVLAQIDQVLRRALGHSSFGGGSTSTSSWFSWTADDVIALTTMLLVFLALFLLLLALKLALGMVLLSFARKRYAGMKDREQERFTDPNVARVGGWGAVEVGEERRRTIYDEAPDELRSLREKERGRRTKEEGRSETKGLEGVDRYAMVAKRIW